MRILKRFIGFSVWLISFSLLCACSMTPPAQQVMEKISVKSDQIDFHIHKKASLIWRQQGDVIAADGGHVNAGGGLIEGVVITTIDSIQTKTDPARFSYAYGKPQQVVFMTSLRENLEKANAFSEVNIATDESEVGAGRVKIIVTFVKTRVGCESDSFPIHLTVKLAIKDGKRVFVRNFFIYSTERQSFKEQQVNASRQLMFEIIKTIKEWGKNG